MLARLDLECLVQLVPKPDRLSGKRPGKQDSPSLSPFAYLRFKPEFFHTWGKDPRNAMHPMNIFLTAALLESSLITIPYTSV